MRISGERSTQQPQPPNARHSHAAPDRPRRAQPNPAHPRQGKTHEPRQTLDKPSYLSPFNQHHDTGRRAGTRNAHTPNMGRARDIDEHNNSAPTLTHTTTRTPTTRRNSSHKRQGPYPDKRTGTVPDAPPTRGRVRHSHNSTRTGAHTTRQAPPLRYTRLTRIHEQQRRQTRR